MQRSSATAATGGEGDLLFPPQFLVIITGRNLNHEAEEMPTVKAVDESASPSTRSAAAPKPQDPITEQPLIFQQQPQEQQQQGLVGSAGPPLSAEGGDPISSDSQTQAKAYRISAEIQEVLIENFFPPIASSTVPGNPGRLYLKIPTKFAPTMD